MQIIHLNQTNFRLYPQVWMVQNDTGRTLKMILDDTTLAGTETGSVAIHRSDGSYYTISATIVGADNAFTADMTQALTQPGLTECQLKVTSSSLVVSTYTFMIHVQASTDGISEEQLGYSVQDLMDAAQTILAGGMPAELQTALLQIAQKVAYIDDQGAQYYQDLYDALQPTVTLLSISAVYTQSGTVYTSDSLDSLKSDLVVTAHYSDGTSEAVLSSMYSLSGTLTVGTSTITVSYDGQTTTFNVTVTQGNLFNPDTDPNVNLFVMTSGMIFGTGNPGQYQSTYISVSPNTTYRVTKNATNQFRIGTSANEPADNVSVLWTDANHTGSSITFTTGSTANYLFITYWYNSGAYDADTVRSSIFISQETTPNRETLFGSFSDGYAVAKATSSSVYPALVPFSYKTATSARATTQAPFVNNNYVFIANSTAYTINAVDVSSTTGLSIPNMSESVDKVGYSCGNKTVGWNTTDSVTTDYCWIALKKNNGTAFTAAELADGAAAVFSYTIHE